MWRRNLTSDLAAALGDSPVVLINGARQVGKSTLARELVDPGERGYFTLDDATVLSAAASAPLSFLEQSVGRVVIDEVQRAPELFLAIKKLVDEDRRPGRFLLTGSANALTLPKIADSLAGRMEIQTLWPLSQGEIEGRCESFIDACFATGPMPEVEGVVWDDLTRRLYYGGYPEVLTRLEPRRVDAWFRAYLTAILERDIRDLANIEGLRELPNLLRLLATRAGGLLSYAELSRIGKVPNTTLKRYIALLEAVFLFIPLPAWFRNEEKRLVKAPKAYLNDTGLLMHLRGLNPERLNDHMLAGPVVENFVVMELAKQRGWSRTLPTLYHFRTAVGKEVDVVLEAPDGRLVGVEVKSTSEASTRDFAGLKELAKLEPERFHRGVVLYTGEKTVSFGANLTAMPLSALWRV